MEFDTNGFGNDLSGWKKKGNTAAEYKSADSNYRTYKPTVSPRPDGGIFISTKIDHIRGRGGDDHCQLELTFDALGALAEARSTISMGDKSFDTGIIKKAAIGAAVAGADPAIAAVAAISADVLKGLTDQIAKWGEDGGRANFPAVIQHNINLIAKRVTK